MIGAISGDMFTQQLDQLRQNGPATSTQDVDESDSSFKNLLGNFIKEVDTSQKLADNGIDRLAMGDQDLTIQDVVTKMEEAEIAFSLMSEIKNKLMTAYKEILRMQS